MTSDKNLIINADDFGLSEEINRAIFLCFKQGTVTSASLLVNGEGFDDALKIIKNNPALDVGLHLNIFYGRPLTNVKHIVDSRGYFLKSLPKFLFKYYFYKKKAKKEIFEEFNRQIEACLVHGVAISHLDAEKHLHVIPGIFESLLMLAEKYKIKYVRFPFEKTISPRLKIDGLQLFKIKISKFFLKKNQFLLNNVSSVKTTDNFYGISLSKKFFLENIKNFFEGLGSGVNELSCHPGTTDKGGTHVDKHRAEEFEVLMNPKIKEYLIKNNIKLTNFVKIDS